MTCNAIKRDSSKKVGKKRYARRNELENYCVSSLTATTVKLAHQLIFPVFFVLFENCATDFHLFSSSTFLCFIIVANFLVCFHWKKITTRKLNKLKRLFYNSYAISRLWKLKHLYFYWIFFVLFHFIFCSSNFINRIWFWPDFIGLRRSIQNQARTFI